MLPEIWIFDSYTLMIVLGIILCFLVFYLYNKKHVFDKGLFLSIIINALFSIGVGLIFAIAFQNLYEYIESPSEYQFTLGMTFYGGLIGGSIFFLLIYFFVQRKKYGPFLKDKLLIIAPSMITIAHGLGRIGCFLSGCCYGIETNSILGMKFPNLPNKVFPTNLYEAIFLIVLSSVLFILAYIDKGKFNFPIYLISYGLFRFSIEFIRGDERGMFIKYLSPSQFWSIIIILIGIGLMIYYILDEVKKNGIRKRNKA